MRKFQPDLTALTSLAFIVLLAGCATPPPEVTTSTPITEKEREQIYKKQRTPELFGITVYPSDSGPVFAGSHRLHPGQMALAPFALLPGGGTPIIAVNPGGSDTHPFLIDTSSRGNWITAQLAAECNLIPLGPPPYGMRAEHVADETGGFLLISQKTKIEELHAENCLYYMKAARGPLGFQARGEGSVKGVLGTPFLRAFNYVVLDFPKGEAIFAASGDYRPEEADLIAKIPLTYVHGAVACEGALDGTPATFILDTAGAFGLTVTEPTEDVVRQISVGDYVARQVPVANSREFGLGLPEYPRIGREILSKFRLVLHFKKKLIYLERQPAAP